MIIEVVTHGTLFTASCTHSDYTQKDISRKKKHTLGGNCQNKCICCRVKTSPPRTPQLSCIIVHTTHYYGVSSSIIIQVETIHIVWLLIQQIQTVFQSTAHP